MLTGHIPRVIYYQVLVYEDYTNTVAMHRPPQKLSLSGGAERGLVTQFILVSWALAPFVAASV